MNSRPERRRQRTPGQRAELLAKFHKSGLTQREFSARNGLSLSCLNLWLRKARDKSTSAVPPTLVRVPVNLTSSEKSLRVYRIGFPGGHSLEVSAGFHPGELFELCQLLRGL